MLYYTILQYTILYYAILYTILYYTLYYTILYYRYYVTKGCWPYIKVYCLKLLELLLRRLLNSRYSIA